MPRTRACTVAAVAAAAALVSLPPAPAQPPTKFDAATDWERFPRLFRPDGIKDGRKVTARPDGSILFEFSPLKAARNSGMRAEWSLRGNFEVEVKYDLTDFPDRSDEGDGVMIGVAVAADPKVGLASVKRGVFRGHGHQNRLTRGVPKEGGKMTYVIAGVPTAAKTGRLVLRRVGTDIIGLSADTADGPLTEWKRYPFTDGPVRVVNLNADAGGSDAAFTARLYDLRVRTGADVPTEPGPPGPVARTITPTPPDLVPVVVGAPGAPKAGTPTGATATAPETADPTDPPPAPLRGRLWLYVVGGLVLFTGGVFIGRRWLR
ncbi:hypothetical protein J0H58_06190 [bacterium]|nr:hypothetical protein [bacterium]